MTTETLHPEFIAILVDVMTEVETDAQVSDKINLLHHVLADFEEYYGSPANPDDNQDAAAIYDALMSYLDN